MRSSTTINSHLSCEQNLLRDVPSDTCHAAIQRPGLSGSCSLVIASPLDAQITVTELQSPYSFVNDPLEKGYFISSVNGEAETADNNGFITKLDPNGKLLNLKFIQGGKDDVTLHAPKGMALVEHVLYVADLDTLRGFDTATGKPVMALTIRSPAASQSERPQASLSDVTFDGKGHLYCSDQKANTIYRVDLAAQTVSVLVTDRALAGPSGLAVHPKSGQIIAVSWDKGKISEISPEGVVTELFSNGFFSNRFQNLRGVDFDRWGNMYVSDFTTGKVWRMSWDKRFQVIAEFLPSPGDLSIDRANNLILVPYELAHAAEMNGLETPSDGKPKQEKRTLADYGFIPLPTETGTGRARKKMSQCAYCTQRKGKRPCPALAGLICSQCCGEHRIVRVSCPADCVYLESGSDYQQKRLAVQFMPVRRDFYRELAELGGKKAVALFNLVEVVIFGYFQSRRDGQDAEIVAALQALRRTLSPLHVPAAPMPVFAEHLEEGVRHVQETEPSADRRYVLRTGDTGPCDRLRLTIFRDGLPIATVPRWAHRLCASLPSGNCGTPDQAT